MSRPLPEIVDRITACLVELDSHWCELTSLGLDLNRAVQDHAQTNRPHLAELSRFKERHSLYIRQSHGAALLAGDAMAISNRLKQQSGEKQGCKRG